jgi:hypothetical protein
MAKTRGMGLLMLWCDVDPEHEEEFNRWYAGASSPSAETGPRSNSSGPPSR